MSWKGEGGGGGGGGGEKEPGGELGQGKTFLSCSGESATYCTRPPPPLYLSLFYSVVGLVRGLCNRQVGVIFF